MCAGSQDFGGQAVHFQKPARRVVAHQRFGIVERADQRRHDNGIADAAELFHRHLPLPVVAGGQNAKDGVKPAPVGTDLPERLRQIDQLVGRPGFIAGGFGLALRPLLGSRTSASARVRRGVTARCRGR